MSCPNCAKLEKKIMELAEKKDQYHTASERTQAQLDKLQRDYDKLKSGMVIEELKGIIRRARVTLNEIL